MNQSRKWHKAESSPQVKLSFLLDTESYSWLVSESERTGIPVEIVSSAVMKRACAEKQPIGAPDRADLPKIFDARITESGEVLLPGEWDEEHKDALDSADSQGEVDLSDTLATYVESVMKEYPNTIRLLEDA